MTLKYTSGPWVTGDQLEKQRPACKITTIAGDTVAEVNCITGTPVNPVDAHLISAAPELYEALCELMNYHNNGISFCHCEACDHGRAAIAKAEGGADVRT